MSFNKFLRYFILTGVFAVPLIPLIVSSGMFFPFITGKNFAFRIIIELIFAAWAILAVRDENYRPKKSLVIMAFAAFICIIAVADVFGENFYRSFWSNYERMEGFIAHLHLFAYFLVLTTTLSTERLWRKFFYTSFGVNLAVIGYSIVQLSGKLPINQGGVRVDATFGNATYLAVYLLFQIFLVAFFLVRGENKDSKLDQAIFPIFGLGGGALVITYSLSSPAYIYFLTIIAVAIAAFPLYLVFRSGGGKPFLWLIVLANLAVLYNTQTRGAVLGLIAGIMTASFFLAVGNWNNKKIRNIAIGVLAGVVILIGLFVSFRGSDFVKGNPTLSRFAYISLKDETTKSRFTIWNMSFQGFKENPVLGWGQDNFISVFGKYYKPSMWGQEPWFDRSHNVFFDWLIAGGLLGLLSYLGLFGAGVYTLWKSLNFSLTEKSILSGLFAGYFFQNLFVFDNLTSYLMFFSLLGFISVMGKTSETAEVTETPKKNIPAVSAVLGETGFYVAVPVVLCAVVASLYFANVKPIMASTTLIKAISQNKDGVSANLEYFKNVFALNTFGSGEAREQLIQKTIQMKGVDPKNVPTEVRQQFLNLANEQMLIQVKQSPTDVRYELYLGSFLSSFAEYDEAVKHLTRAVELSPNKQMVLFEIASAYINKGDPASALPYLERAYEGAPEYPEAVVIYATGLIYSGQVKEGEALLMEKYGTILVPDNRILSAYSYRQMYDRVISILKGQIAKSPDDQQLRLSLAGEYLRAGQRENAVSEIEFIISKNPSFKDQGQYYINEIRAGRNP